MAAPRYLPLTTVLQLCGDHDIRTVSVDHINEDNDEQSARKEQKHSSGLFKTIVLNVLSESPAICLILCMGSSNLPRHLCRNIHRCP